ncbi:MAG TPA: lipopolysaccharide biosynthesis protein [Bryobacteraceae bacterium]|nr:lipopolysaccharide biosynthesis protein [Bryobacteraceae bacterium]
MPNPVAESAATSARPSFLSQSSLYFLSNVARRGLSFFLLPIYTRYLSPSEYGVIEIIELLAAVMVVVVGVPMFADSITRIYFDYSEAKERASVVSTGMILTIALSSMLVVIGAFGGGAASHVLFHSPDYARLIAWTFASVLLSNVAEVGLAYQRIQRRAAFVAIYSCAQFALAGGLNVYFLAVARQGIWGFVFSKFISLGLGAAFILALTVRETGFRFRAEQSKRMIHLGRGFILTGVGFFIINFSDRAFLNSFRTTTEVGIYALAYKFGFVISYLVGNPFKSVWEVNVFDDMHSPQWKQHAAKMARVLALCLAAAALPLSVFGKPIIHMVAAPSYAAAAGLIPILTFAYALREIGDFFNTAMLIRKRMAQYAGAVVLSAAFNLAVEWVLIRAWGAAGAAWATFLTWGLYAAICWVMAQREHQIPVDLGAFGFLAATCALTVGVVLSLGDFGFAPDVLIRLAIMLLTGALIWKSRCVAVGERAQIRNRLREALIR